MPVITPDKLPHLNSATKYLLRRHRNRLLDMPCTRDTSALVDCIDFLLEAGRKVDHAE